MNRRSFLGVLAGGATGLVAGCTEEESTDREQGTGDGNDGSSDSGGSDDGSGGSGGGGPLELLSHEWYNQGQFDAGVRGQVENVSDETLGYVQVDVYFLDADGVQFQESLDNTTDLTAGRVWEFDAMFLGDDPNRVDSYEAEATTF